MLNCTFIQYQNASKTARRRTDACLTKVAQISTKTVYKVVENHPVDMSKPSRNAGLNKLLVVWAKLNLHKINGLRGQAQHKSTKFAR
jgi:hypothetical protein